MVDETVIMFGFRHDINLITYLIPTPNGTTFVPGTVPVFRQYGESVDNSKQTPIYCFLVLFRLNDSQFLLPNTQITLKFQLIR